MVKRGYSWFFVTLAVLIFACSAIGVSAKCAITDADGGDSMCDGHKCLWDSATCAVGCKSDADCASRYGYRCDQKAANGNGDCVKYGTKEVGEKCGGSTECKSANCGTHPDQILGDNTKTCLCYKDADCSEGSKCFDNDCLLSSCTVDSQCQSGEIRTRKYVCDEGECKIGSPFMCASDDQCAAGNACYANSFYRPEYGEQYNGNPIGYKICGCTSDSQCHLVTRASVNGKWGTDKIIAQVCNEAIGVCQRSGSIQVGDACRATMSESYSANSDCTSGYCENNAACAGGGYCGAQHLCFCNDDSDCAESSDGPYCMSDSWGNKVCGKLTDQPYGAGCSKNEHCKSDLCQLYFGKKDALGNTVTEGKCGCRDGMERFDCPQTATCNVNGCDQACSGGECKPKPLNGAAKCKADTDCPCYLGDPDDTCQFHTICDTIGGGSCVKLIGNQPAGEYCVFGSDCKSGFCGMVSGAVKCVCRSDADCGENSQCDANTKLCAELPPKPECTTSGDCKSPTPQCLNQKCVECTEATVQLDCINTNKGKACVSNACKACALPADCGDGNTCTEDNTCAPKPCVLLTDCTESQICMNGACTNAAELDRLFYKIGWYVTDIEGRLGEQAALRDNGARCLTDAQCKSDKCKGFVLWSRCEA